MSYFLSNGDSGNVSGTLMFGVREPDYRIPSHPCAVCGHVVRHEDPEGLRELARQHYANAHAEVTA